MLSRVVFWVALAVAFLLLAIVAWRERKRVRAIERPLGGLEHIAIPGPVAKAVTNILRVEAIGFLLAAAAAIYEALT